MRRRKAEPDRAATPSGLFEPGGRLVADYAGWLRAASGVAREKDELTALHDDLGHRFLDLEAVLAACTAEVEVLREANARLTRDYDELARAQQDTMAALTTASAALRTLGSS